MGLALTLRRIRHGRGFGIHSPYAFRFITEVLHQRHIYYYYAYALVPDDILSAHDWKLLVRLAVHFRPSVIALGPGVPSRVGRFLRKVAPGATFGSRPDFLVAFNEVPEEYRQAVNEGNLHTVVFNSKSMPDPTERTHGMVFGNSHSWIMAAHAHLPSQNFDVQY